LKLRFNHELWNNYATGEIGKGQVVLLRDCEMVVSTQDQIVVEVAD
jgi:hypothetical protein